MNDRPKLLQKFLVENSTRNTVGVPHLETPIRTKRMLELHHEIVQQLESLKSGAESARGASRRSGRVSSCAQIRAVPKMPLLGVVKSCRCYRWNGDAQRWDHIPLDVHVGYGADPSKVFHFPVLQIFTSVAPLFALSLLLVFALSLPYRWIFADVVCQCQSFKIAASDFESCSSFFGFRRSDQWLTSSGKFLPSLHFPALILNSFWLVSLRPLTVDH
jgi:hypothetical protein